MSAYTERVRTARKTRRCSWGRCRAITPGERYIEATEFPGGEAGYADAAGHPVRMAVCSDCAGDRVATPYTEQETTNG